MIGRGQILILIEIYK